jgi:hypothetical protein
MLLVQGAWNEAGLEADAADRIRAGRASTRSRLDTLLAPARLSPTGTALSVVLVNAGNAEVDTKLTVPAGIATTTVTCTVFGGAERGAPLGSLSNAGILGVPARAIVTVAFAP